MSPDFNLGQVNHTRTGAAEVLRDEDSGRLLGVVDPTCGARGVPLALDRAWDGVHLSERRSLM